MKRALVAGTVYFLALFALGFVLGTIRVIIVAPSVGAFAAVMAEIPIILTAAFFSSQWTIRRWNVPCAAAIRWAMVLWFLVLLLLFETLLGAMLFGRTVAEQWGSLQTPAGLLGLSAQVIAALLPVFVGNGELA